MYKERGSRVYLFFNSSSSSSPGKSINQSMAISLLRRAVSARNLYFVPSSAARSRDFSYSCSSCFSNSYVTSETPPAALFGGGTHHHLLRHESIGGGRGSNRSIGFDFLKQSRRGFAKGRKSKDGDGANTAVVTIDVGPIKTSTASLMDAAIDSLSRELSKLRTGRASAGMLDHIIIETSGVKMPLSRMAVVSVMDAQTLSITPYDPNAIKELENAIVSSPLGINPKLDGQRLIAPIPQLTKESIQAMCKVVTKSSEDVKQSIRRARQKALDTIKKAATSIPKDDVKRLEKEVDEMTKKFVKSTEDMCKAKEKEITSG